VNRNFNSTHIVFPIRTMVWISAFIGYVRYSFWDTALHTFNIIQNSKECIDLVDLNAWFWFIRYHCRNLNSFSLNRCRCICVFRQWIWYLDYWKYFLARHIIDIVTCTHYIVKMAWSVCTLYSKSKLALTIFLVIDLHSFSCRITLWKECWIHLLCAHLIEFLNVLPILIR
jgi:hypothetical protein